MSEHYFTKRPTSALRTQQIVVELLGEHLEFTTGSGVFSRTRLDKGSEVLIRYAEIRGDERLLDLGCGWGAVGITLKKAYPALQVTCSDINERAVMLCKKNAEINGVAVKTIRSDGFEKISGTFDTILLNPPQTAGKAVCLRLINGSYEHLVEGGTLQLVARHSKGGRSLSEHMESLFGNVRKVKSRSGYRVYLSVKEA